MKNTEPNYFDESFEFHFPGWKDLSPDEYFARHWLQYGACSIVKNNHFKNQEMLEWVTRFEEIFHSPELIEECRKLHLTCEEIRAQDKQRGRSRF